MDYMLKTTTETTMISALQSAGVATVRGSVLVAGDGFYIDMIGNIPGATGYHANVRAVTATESLLPVVLPIPSTPYRAFLD